MKSENALRLGFTYAGCFLGAGYVSGQELWQFFGSFGLNGGKGLLLSMLLFLLFGILLLRLIQKSGVHQADALVVEPPWPVLRAVVGILEVFFLFGIFVIMAAGVGALSRQMLGIPAGWGSAVFCITVMIVSLRGTSGMMSVFSCVVPLLVICAVTISLIAVTRYGWQNIHYDQGVAFSGNPLLRNWWIAAITYVCYNLFSSIGILAPVGGLIRSKRTVYLGILSGCIILLAIAGSIFLVLLINPAAANAQLPMLEVAKESGLIWYYLYGLLLLGGMFGTSLSCMVAAQNYVYERLPRIARRRIPSIFLLGFAAWLGSLWGFGDLVGTVYPICGYCGAFAMLGILLHYFSVTFRKSSKLHG